MAAIIWLVLGVVLAVAEAFSMGFVLIMLAAGAFAAAGAAALGAPLVLQAVVFAGVSAASVWAVRPAIRRHFGKLAITSEPMGVAALEGAEALVLERVDTDHGLIKVSGETWTARPFDATESFEAGERVHIMKIKGATALVWRM